ncbi:MAG: oxidoreductase [Halobacteriales archaeon]
MGLRCLIGHDYGEPRTERDRRERGSEVVVTVREYRECRRCGHQRVLSENTEVTTEAADQDAGAAETDASAADWSPPEPEGPGLDDPPTYDSERADEPASAAEDDGIILDDEPDEPVRDHGEWPDAEVGDEAPVDATDHEPWPDESAAEEASPPAAVDTSTATADDGSADVTGDGADEPVEDSGGPRGEPAPSRPDNQDTELVCPDCGETWPSLNASLRPGDICPECRQGYLDEQVIQ